MWYLQYWDSLLHSFQFALKEVGPCHEVLKGKLPLARNQTALSCDRTDPLSVCTLSSKGCVTATDLSKCFLSMCQLIAVLHGFSFLQVFFINELISSKDWAITNIRVVLCREGKTSLYFLLNDSTWIHGTLLKINEKSFACASRVEMQILFIILQL